MRHKRPLPGHYPEPDIIKRQRADIDITPEKTFDFYRERFSAKTNPSKLPTKWTSWPTPLTRLNAFYPISKRKMKDRPFVKEKIVNAWGEITIGGDRLGVYDLDTAFALLSLIKRHKNSSFITNLHQICLIRGISPASDTYNAIWESLIRLTTVTFHMKPRNSNLELAGALIPLVAFDKKTKEIAISVNIYFFRALLDEMVTWINYETWHKLRGDEAKLLYVFMMSQPKKYDIGLEKICDNRHIEGTMSVRRHKILKCLREIDKQERLEDYRIDKNNHVWWTRKTKPKAAPFFKAEDTYPEITNYLKDCYEDYRKRHHHEENIQYSTEDESKIIAASKKIQKAVEMDDLGIEVMGEPRYMIYVKALFEILMSAYKNEKHNIRPGALCGRNTWQKLWAAYVEKDQPKYD